MFEAKLEAVEGLSTKIYFPCGNGRMPFRIWPMSSHHRGSEALKPEAAKLVLCHGGSGSWTHWIKNIPEFAKHYDVIVPDLPGLGESASLAEGYQPLDAAKCVAEGLTSLLGDTRFHLVAFSWGSVVASLVAGLLGSQVSSVMLVGPASMGKMPTPLRMMPLIARTKTMSSEEVQAANRENLCRLMIADKQRIDDFAVYLQTRNTQQARFKSPQFASGRYVLEGLAQATAPAYVIYGDKDASAVPNIAYRKQNLQSVRPDARFEVYPDIGHWFQYEADELFNELCLAWLEEIA